MGLKILIIINLFFMNCSKIDFPFKKTNEQYNDPSVKKNNLSLMFKSIDKLDYSDYYRLVLRKKNKVQLSSDCIDKSYITENHINNTINYEGLEYSGVLKFDSEYSITIPKGNYTGYFIMDSNEYSSSVQAGRITPLIKTDSTMIEIYFVPNYCNLDNKLVEENKKCEKISKSRFICSELKIGEFETKLLINFKEKKFSIKNSSLMLIPIIMFPFTFLMRGFAQYEREVELVIE